MAETIEEVDGLKVPFPSYKSSILQIGASRSGKSTFTAEFVKTALEGLTLNPPPEKVLICTGSAPHHQPLYTNLVKNYPTKVSILSKNETPELDWLEGNQLPTIVIFDDLQLVLPTEYISRLFCNVVSHAPALLVIFHCHDPFYDAKMKIIRRNATFTVLHRYPVIGTVACLARSWYSNNSEAYKRFMLAYKDAVLQTGYGYLIISFHSAGDLLYHAMTDILPTETNDVIVYDIQGIKE